MGLQILMGIPFMVMYLAFGTIVVLTLVGLIQLCYLVSIEGKKEQERYKNGR